MNLATLLLGLTRSAAVAAITPFVIVYCIPALKANVPVNVLLILGTYQLYRKRVV